MDVLYACFVRAGDLAFDIGAHVGDRIASFRRLGAKVVALEPQPDPARLLRLLYARDPHVRLLRAAAGPENGETTLRINSRNPTVSTAADRFVEAARGAPGWEGQVWDEALTVPCVTLDALIRQLGLPAFIKIDVEGFEDEVLAGLNTQVPALSFEFTTIVREVASRCLDRMEALGPYRFDVVLGETQDFVFERFIGVAEMRTYLSALPHAANSGDVYAVLT